MADLRARLLLVLSSLAVGAGVALLAMQLTAREPAAERARYPFRGAREASHDLEVIDLLRSVRDDLRAVLGALQESSAKTRATTPTSRAGEEPRDRRGGVPLLPHTDLGSVASLAQWKEDVEIRRRWFLLDAEEAAGLFGVPDRVNIGEGGGQYWVYHGADGQQVAVLVFHGGKLIDVFR